MAYRLEISKAAQITLREITRDNWRECVALDVAEDQRRFVAPNAKSLLQCFYQDPTDTLAPFGIYDGDTMVGFIMYGQSNFDGKSFWEIWRLMVDARYQRKGYARAALVQMIALMRDRLACDEIYIMFLLDNAAAQTLYESVGFVDTGMVDDGEKIFRLDVSADGRADAV
jgi:diamine N-acetyltransferase